MLRGSLKYSKKKRKRLTEELETILALKERDILDFQMCHKMKTKLNKSHVKESKLNKFALAYY